MINNCNNNLKLKRNNILLYVCLLSVLTCNVIFPQTKNKPKIIALPGFVFNINKNNAFQLTQENRFYYNATDNLLSYREFSISGKLLVRQIRNLY